MTSRSRQKSSPSAGWGAVRVLPLPAPRGLRQARPGHRPTAACRQSSAVLRERHSYGSLLRIAPLKDIAWRFVILDEAQAIKNASAKQTRAAKVLKASARIALTTAATRTSPSPSWRPTRRKLVFVFRSGIVAQRLAQRQMLRLGAGREAR
jgi:SNF2-related domain